MLYKIATVVIIAFIVCSAGPALAQTYQGGSLEGSVTDATTQEGIEGVRLVFAETGRNTRTDSEGSFSIGNLEPGVYSLTISHDDYQDYHTRVVIDEGYNSLTVEIVAETQAG